MYRTTAGATREIAFNAPQQVRLGRSDAAADAALTRRVGLAFNQALDWDTSKVTNMEGTFNAPRPSPPARLGHHR